MLINCDATIFRNVSVDWIARETIVIIFIVANINILFVKQAENKMTSYLAHFNSKSGCIVSSDICDDCDSVFLMNAFCQQKKKTRPPAQRLLALLCSGCRGEDARLVQWSDDSTSVG